MSFRVCDSKASMLFSLTNKRILLCFSFLFLVMLSNFLIIPVVRENIIVKLVPAIPTSASTTLTEEIIQTPPPVSLKTFKTLSM